MDKLNFEIVVECVNPNTGNRHALCVQHKDTPEEYRTQQILDQQIQIAKRSLEKEILGQHSHIV